MTGFKHTPGRPTNPEGVRITMSCSLDIGLSHCAATWDDHDALRCVLTGSQN